MYIVNINIDVNGKYVSILILIVFVIDDNIVTCYRAVDCDYVIKGDKLIIS